MLSALAVPSISFDLPAFAGAANRSETNRNAAIRTSERGPPPIAQRSLGSGELCDGLAGDSHVHFYLCLSTLVSCTTLSTISPAMSSAALRSSSFL